MISELLETYPSRWPLTERYGNTLSVDGLDIIDGRAGGIVNHYDQPPTEADLIDELDCQESALSA